MAPPEQDAENLSGGFRWRWEVDFALFYLCFHSQRAASCPFQCFCQYSLQELDTGGGKRLKIHMGRFRLDTGNNSCLERLGSAGIPFPIGI